jgi:hypothetical protein
MKLILISDVDFAYISFKEVMLPTSLGMLPPIEFHIKFLEMELK